MKSPFPGMDPYLETVWGDVDTTMAVFLREQLRPQMPPDLAVRIEEYVTKLAERDPPGEKSARYGPDARVIERGTPVAVSSAGTITAEAAEPLIISIGDDPETWREVRIIDKSTGGRLVTAIEILSPANKVGATGRCQYRRKRLNYLRAKASVVELDFLRAGRPITFVTPGDLPPNYRSPYRICVVRGWKRAQVEVYPATFRERLPIIRIPLRKTDPDAKLDLQGLIDTCYEAGTYADMNYTVDPEPPFGITDATWADAWLKQAGRR